MDVIVVTREFIDPLVYCKVQDLRQLVLGVKVSKAKRHESCL